MQQRLTNPTRGTLTQQPIKVRPAPSRGHGGAMHPRNDCPPMPRLSRGREQRITGTPMAPTATMEPWPTSTTTDCPPPFSASTPTSSTAPSVESSVCAQSSKTRSRHCATPWRTPGKGSVHPRTNQQSGQGRPRPLPNPAGPRRTRSRGVPRRRPVRVLTAQRPGSKLVPGPGGWAAEGAPADQSPRREGRDPRQCRDQCRTFGP